MKNEEILRVHSFRLPKECPLSPRAEGRVTIYDDSNNAELRTLRYDSAPHCRLSPFILPAFIYNHKLFVTDFLPTSKKGGLQFSALFFDRIFTSLYN